MVNVDDPDAARRSARHWLMGALVAVLLFASAGCSESYEAKCHRHTTLAQTHKNEFVPRDGPLAGGLPALPLSIQERIWRDDERPLDPRTAEQRASDAAACAVLRWSSPTMSTTAPPSTMTSTTTSLVTSTTTSTSTTAPPPSTTSAPPASIWPPSTSTTSTTTPAQREMAAAGEAALAGDLPRWAHHARRAATHYRATAARWADLCPDAAAQYEALATHLTDAAAHAVARRYKLSTDASGRAAQASVDASRNMLVCLDRLRP